VEKKGKVDYGLQPSKSHSEMDEKLRKLREIGGTIVQERPR
jgi:hypothetical protein